MVVQALTGRKMDITRNLKPAWGRWRRRWRFTLRQEIKRFTGLEICEVAKDKATAAVQVFSVGKMAGS